MRIFVKSFLTAAAVIFGAVMFPGDVSAVEKEEGKQYIILMDDQRGNRDRINFVACDTPENYDKYMKSFNEKDSDNVMISLRDEKKCVLMTNDFFSNYYIRIKSMNPETGAVTEIIKEGLDGINTPYFTRIKPDKKLIQPTPYSAERMARRKSVFEQRKQTEGKKIKADNGYFCETFEDFRLVRYTEDRNLEKLIYRTKCLGLTSDIELEIVKVDESGITEYKVLSGSMKGKFVYAIYIE